MPAVTSEDIRRYYRDYLNRNPSPEEVRYWQDSGLDRKGVETGIRHSPEHERLVEKHRPKELDASVDFDVYFGTDADWHNTSRNTVVYAPHVVLKKDEYKTLGQGFFFDEGQDRGGVFGRIADVTGISEIRKFAEDVIPSEFWPVVDLYTAGYGSAITGGRQAAQQSAKWYGEEGLQWMRFAGDTAVRIGLNYAFPMVGAAVSEVVIGGLHAGSAWAQGLEADYADIFRDTAINAGIALGTSAIAQGFYGKGALASLGTLGVDPRVAASVTVGTSASIRSYLSDRDWRKSLIAGALAGTANYLMSEPTKSLKRASAPEQAGVRQEVLPEAARQEVPPELAQKGFDPLDVSTWYDNGKLTEDAVGYFTAHPETLQTMGALESFRHAQQPPTEQPWYTEVLKSGAFWGATISSLVSLASTMFILSEQNKADREAEDDLRRLYSEGIGGGGGGSPPRGNNPVRYYSVYSQRGTAL